MSARRRQQRIRLAIAREAARLMYEEGVRQYFDAKRMAARRVLGRDGGRTATRHRPRFLPSNGEIQSALLELVELTEGAERGARLFAMRVVALEHMRALSGFHPRLIGSVRSGHAHRGSDVDLHVFSESVERIEARLHALGWIYELERVMVRVGSGFRTYTHACIDALFPVELSIYGLSERRVRTRSSTDGRPIERMHPDALEALLAREHPEAWADYGVTGALPEPERWEEEGAYMTLADVEALADEA